MSDRDRRWGAALGRLDAEWQALEARLCACVLVSEIGALSVWVALKAASSAGLHWPANLLNWLQNASVLMLIGGLRGLATRLTLWLALLGASLATSRGKHIHVDVVARHVPVALRAPVAGVVWLAAALVCGAAALGFADHIAIAEFRAPAVKPCDAGPSFATCETSAREKRLAVTRALSADLFLLGRQTALDARTLPRVVVGVPYDGWMTAAEWNAWLDGADWTAHFDRAAVLALRMDPDSPDAKRMPQVVVPGTGEQARGLLVRELDFVFPFGLSAIALKFILRTLLLAVGRVDLDPDAAHREPEVGKADDVETAA